MKTFWRRLENVLKKSWRRIAKTNILVLTKTSSEDEDKRRLQDVFIKTNVCWVISFRSFEHCSLKTSTLFCNTDIVEFCFVSLSLRFSIFLFCSFINDVMFDSKFLSVLSQFVLLNPQTCCQYITENFAEYHSLKCQKGLAGK